MLWLVWKTVLECGGERFNICPQWSRLWPRSLSLVSTLAPTHDTDHTHHAPHEYSASSLQIYSQLSSSLQISPLTCWWDHVCKSELWHMDAWELNDWRRVRTSVVHQMVQHCCPYCFNYVRFTHTLIFFSPSFFHWSINNKDIIDVSILYIILKFLRTQHLNNISSSFTDLNPVRRLVLLLLINVLESSPHDPGLAWRKRTFATTNPGCL